MGAQSGKLDVRHVRRRFDRAADRFDDGDFVHRTTFDGLMERLLPLLLEPAVIVDLGAATGSGSRQLARRFRKARVISVDFSGPMLRRARSARPMFSKTREVQGDALQLPLVSACADLVVANMLLPWIEDLPGCLSEIGRVLGKGGVFAFVTLGPDSFAAVGDADVPPADAGQPRPFADMHDVGDELVRAGLADPVIDVDRLIVTWPDTEALARDLAASGTGNSLRDRRGTLTGKRRFQAMLERFRDAGENGGLAIELELVYGHAWGSGARLPDGEFRLEPGSIGRRVRN